MLNRYSLFIRTASGLLPLICSVAAQAQAPVLLNVAPAANAHSAARTTGVVASFSRPLTAASVTALKVFSSQRGGLRGNGVATVVGANLGFFPTAYPFMPGETVQLTVTRAAASADDSLATPWVQQFTTAVGGTGRGDFRLPAGLAEPSVGTAPQSVAVGDLDADGDLDLITANAFATGTLSVRLNDGAATFTAPATNAEIAVGSAPRNLALGDLDGDGDLDLVAANSFSNTLSVRLNDGSSNFSVPQSAQLTTGMYPLGVALGDIDGDGDLDLVVANNQSASVSVFSNDGTALFTSLATASVAVGQYPYAVALGDVDNDGDLDLLASNTSSNTVSIRLNNGSSVFTAPALNAECPVAFRPQGIALGDVDADGDLDFVTASSNGNMVSVRLNTGAGAFVPSTTLPEVPVGSFPYNVALTDVNSDGHLDLLAVNAGANSVSLRLNNGSGRFLPPATSAEIPVSSNPLALAVGDLDSDGDIDLLAPSQSSYAVSVRLNGGTGPLAVRSGATAEALAVYPNPATGQVRLRLPATARRAELLNALGQVVCTVPALAGAATLHVAGLVPGIYLVRSAGQVARLVVE
ncbi:Por secretion system C-terminal sorting domain-containing protein [Hymenobacter daecheongensis DSM 21074]|uniref:Por secretion system C-terminal sorting domain-containing protein n=1 Tax=Hymenobacter daecheongensis DSM 21074 TaxID=1121955 RepID=A0A1M6AAL4_9BACT|nr:T9SS type A sorting domain-containing protein [Hymenobacter daecheongensis]SHI33515.1 Por secretion system C-terminal sorting domain-containing protein [Hymenobacter daecheongensis DSM 21074]